MIINNIIKSFCRIVISAEALFLTSCTTELEIPYDEGQTKYALSCLCNSNEKLSLYVYKTYPIDSSIYQSYEAEVVKHLEVNLLENGEYVASGTLKDDSMYVVGHNVIPSREYSLEISDTINQIKLRVTDSIPSYDYLLNNLSATYNKDVYCINEDGDILYLVTLRFEDEINTENYYQLLIPGEFKIDSPIISYDSYDDGYYPVLFSDKLFENGEIELSYFCSTPSSEIKLRNVSYNYYLYQKSLQAHLESQNTLYYDDTPIDKLFSTNPTELYTNVDGGLGIFATYTEVSIIPVDANR